MTRIPGLERAARGFLPENKALLTDEAQRATAAGKLARTAEDRLALGVEGTLRQHDKNTARLRAGAAQHEDAGTLPGEIAERETDPKIGEMRHRLAELTTLTAAVAAGEATDDTTDEPAAPAEA